ncbi:DUF2529 family protein [Bacillaceae bacterium SIJ1]|uniref:DUF2529 family protein n=1 Tax=Litoribacterium kuwaitense TaxID=1398745 RepID=UPI0013ECD712|nr:DUF2529 family protein [Litoribacterium kuwaitense]NGP44712.1 DUF2529 family protein [Litoribacterium kuwaitense]
MFQIIPTQALGHFKKMAVEEPSYEDGARLLAQAITSQGTIYAYTKNEGHLVLTLAEHSSDQSILQLKPILSEQAIDQFSKCAPTDRLLISVPWEDDPEAVHMCQLAQEHGLEVLTLASLSESPSSSNGLSQRSDVFIPLHVQQGLFLDEDGNRHLKPHSLAFIMAYHWLTLLTKEIINEQ